MKIKSKHSSAKGISFNNKIKEKKYYWYVYSLLATGYYGTPMTDSQPAVGSSEADPEGMYGAGGISPEELQGGDKPQYGRSGNFQNMPPT